MAEPESQARSPSLHRPCSLGGGRNPVLESESNGCGSHSSPFLSL